MENISAHNEQESSKITVEEQMLIAKFVAMRVDSHNGDTWIVGHTGQEIWHNASQEDWKFHTSWDWLISACRKFNDLNISNELLRKEWLTVKGKRRGSKIGKAYVSYCDKIDDAVTRNYNIKDVFPILIEAITWYNSTDGQQLKK